MIIFRPEGILVENNMKAAVRRKITTRDIVMCALFTALITAGAFIRIPVPVVPFTLQFLFTMLAGLLMGGRLGAISVGVYTFLGLVGLPIFAEGGGIWYIFKPSFGYIIGFIVASYVTGRLVEKLKELKISRILAANFIGLLIVYAMGMIYYYIIYNIADTKNRWPEDRPRLLLSGRASSQGAALFYRP